MSQDITHELKIFKVKIKKWEAEFFSSNSKKPSKEDIHDAPPAVKEAYRNYWKLKNSTDFIQEGVWGENLNKSYQKSGSANRKVSNVKSFCDKIKKRSSFGLIKKNYPVSINSKELNNSENATIPNDGDGTNIAEDSKMNVITVNSFQESSVCDAKESLNSEIDALIELPQRKTPAKFIKTFNKFNTVKNINMLSPTVDLNNRSKTLHFKQSLNEDWLKRCDESISKDTNCDLDYKSHGTSNEDMNNKSDAFNDNQENMSIQSSNSICNKSASTLDRVNLTSSECVKEECSISAKISDETTSKQLTNNAVNDSETLFSNRNSHDKISINNDSNSDQILNSNANCKLMDQDQVNKEITEDNQMKDSVKSKKRKLSAVSHFPEPIVSKKAAILKRKIAAGTLNENFVALNIKKKKFCRGHRSVNIRKLKWNKWKQLKKSSGNNTSNVSGCFKCGEFGHWAKQCNASTSKKETETFLEEENLVDTPLPTLEEAAKLAQEAKTVTPYRSFRPAPIRSVKANPLNEEHMENIDISKDFTEKDSSNCPVDPLYGTTEDGSPIKTPQAVFDALHEMGYSDFRIGQEAAIMRVLCGLSTLVVLPTGSGKSLCYQLPAYMYAKHCKSLAVVVSPLVSLMEDQVTGLPACLHAVCLHSGMTEIQKANAMKDITEGSAQILLVSPEAIIGSRRFAGSLLNSALPPISFVCIDEVHCISQWSHNFRPSYLQLYKVLTQKMGIKCILGLTATATTSTTEDIISHLRLKCENVVGNTKVPSNLHLSISRDKDKDKALLQLLNGDRFHKCSSIIVYCIRRAETERLAALLRTCLQDEEAPPEDQRKKKKQTKSKKCFAWTVEAYHAGLAPPTRRSIQKKFMSGKLRVVIATVAFGMGLDKPDVRAIIHYNMPKTFESYVQEIGRAGRDGLDSHCHLFLDNEGNDIWEQQKHIYANSIDRHTLRKLLKRVFQPCKCSPAANLECQSTDMEIDSKGEENKCPKHEVAFPMNETIQELDVKEENVSTLLCYLELHSKHWIEILPPVYSTCTIRCYGGSTQMHGIAIKNPVVATAMALASENGKKWEKSSSFSFPVVQVASAIGWSSSAAKQNLKSLEWNDNKRKTGTIVEFSDLAFHVLAPGNLSGEELDEVLDFLYNKVVTTEETELKNLKLLFSVFKKFSFPRYWDCCDEVNEENSESIKTAINKYFTSELLHEESNDGSTYLPAENSEVDLGYIRTLIKEMICTHHDQSFSGRSIARIFHGIGSPCFPAEVWGRVRKYWRCLLSVNFNSILKMANEELRNFK